MKNIKPINVMHEHNLHHFQLNAVLEGITMLLRLAGVEQKIQVRNLGPWRHHEWHDRNHQLLPYRSLDWYLKKARETSAHVGQVFVDTILDNLLDESEQTGGPHYDVVILTQDIYSGQTHFVIGAARHERAMIFSVCRFAELAKELQRDCIITETMHELGHVFGLVPAARRDNIEESLGRHCTNICVMRQGISVPSDWEKFTEDRIITGAPLCSTCLRDLVKHFQ